MSSLQGELLDIRDYVSKVDAWAKRINAREVMRERNGDVASSGSARVTSSRPAAGSKDELRKIAGITAGRPAPHGE